MTKTEVKENVKKMMTAGSCCPEAKAVGEAYLKAADTDKEHAAAEALLQELKEDVTTIDEIIGFIQTDDAKQAFGEAQAAGMLDAAKKSKAAGGKWCICDACQAGGALLDHATDVLA